MMDGTVAVTDFDWYTFLLAAQPAEVNFWAPSDRRRFSAPHFSPFFFKLKAPYRAICGFGYFARWTSLPDWLAWECFGVGNGATSLDSLRARIGDIRRRIGYVSKGSLDNLGCTLVVQPTFFPPEAWIPQPADWPERTLSTMKYDLTIGEGRRVWDACRERSGSVANPAFAKPTMRPVGIVAGSTPPRYGAPQLIAPRLGQGSFRASVLDAYSRSCAVTEEHSLPALEAAHIRAFDREGPHEVRNGLLLRADLHRLFDKGYVTITGDGRLEVSERLRKDYSNGRSYYPLHGAVLHLPRAAEERPAKEFLDWHQQHVYLR
jgi:putative restriction endonuclease